MITSRWWCLGGALLAVAALAGCRSRPAAPAKPGEAPATTAAEEGAKPASAPDEQPAPGAEGEAAPRAPGRSTDPNLAELSGEALRLEEQRRFLVQKYTELADDAYASGEWEKARGKYSEVLDLDPGNAHATRRIAEIGAHLNERGPSAGAAFEAAREEAGIKREKARMEVALLAESGRDAEKAGKFDEAIAAYEKALVIVEVSSYTVDFSPDGDALRRMIAAAKESRSRSDTLRRQKEVDQARVKKEAEAARERAQRSATIQTLFRDANASMEAERYSTAVVLFEQILAIDPTNGRAERGRATAVRAANAQYDETVRKSAREEWKRAFEDLQKEVIPQTDLVKFSDTWTVREGLRAVPQFSTASAFEDDPQSAAIRAKIEAVRTPLTISNDQTPITDILAWLSDLTGVNIVLDGKAREGKSDADLTVQTYNLTQPLSVKEILDLLAAGKGLGWKVQNGVVLVTTQERVRGKPVLDLYDVKDVTAGILDFPADDINLQPSGGGGFQLPVDEGTEPRKPIEGEKIKDLITNNIDKEIWGQEGANVEFREPGTLVVKAPVATHAKIRKLLSDLRNTGGMQVSIETRFVTVSDNFLQDIGVDLRGLGDDSLGSGLPGKGTQATFDDVLAGTGAAPAGIGTNADSGVFYNFIHGAQDLRARVENLYDVALGKAGVLLPTGGTTVQATYLDDTQVEAILRAVQKSERSTQVVAPRVTAYNAQRSNVQVLNQVSYVSDYDVEIAQLAQIGDPIVQQLRDGIILDIRPVISADRRYITMELRPTVAVLTRPIATFSTTLGNGPPVSIQLPEIRIQRVRTTVTVPDGGTLMLGGLRFFQEQRLDTSVPFLSDIPVLSFFWTRQGTYVERRNLFILLKATIIRLEEHEPSLGRRG
jgi:type II secretory pathway component GspD/PulD (secretin)